MTDAQRSPNRDRLLRTARLLRPLLGEFVFVGGQVAELLVTDPAAVRVRPTDDVDVVVPITTRTAYHALQQRLMALGFTPDHRAGAPVCRMRTADHLLLDVMPLDEAMLGFSNRWYSYAFASAATVTLEPGLNVRVASAAAFLAMKWEAFASRGAADPMSSHDLEDPITVVAGRASIVPDVQPAPDKIGTSYAHRPLRCSQRSGHRPFSKAISRTRDAYRGWWTPPYGAFGSWLSSGALPTRWS